MMEANGFTIDRVHKNDGCNIIITYTHHETAAKSAESTPEAPKVDTEETPNNADVDERNEGETDNSNYHALTLMNMLLQIENVHLTDLLNNEEYGQLKKQF